MFIDRDQILTRLDQIYKEGRPLCVSLYSRHGEGKSRLLREFSKGKKVLYYAASCVPWEENFQLLKDLCLRKFGSAFSSPEKFSQLLKMLKKESAREPFVLILDHFQYLAFQNRRLFSQLTALSRESSSSSRMLIILCKPSHLWEKESPKEEEAFLLRPFHFFEMRRLCPDLSYIDQILLYSITGGVPGLMEYFPPGSSLQENLEKLFFTEKGVLYRAIPFETGKYYGSSAFIGGILGAVGKSPKHLQEICDRTGLSPSAAGSLLASLENHGIIEKIVPVTEEPSSRRALYRISHNAFRFWYAFVYPYQSEIEAGRGPEIFHKQILSHLSSYLKDTFQDICREFLRESVKTGTSPFPMERVGMWWGQHPTKKRTEYISIAASWEDQILLGDCFWTDDWIDADGLSRLQKHAGLFPEKEKWYYLFSTSDFVYGFEAMSGSHVRVFSLDKMCRIMGNL